MSAVCVLTPVVEGSWALIGEAIRGAAAALGFREAEAGRARGGIEIEIPNSRAVAEGLGSGEAIVLERDGISLRFERDERGRCSVCASGEGFPDRDLRRAAEEMAGRMVQQFVYHKLLTELKGRGFSVVEEEVLADRSVHVRVRRG
jgi:hypothetical protein